MITPQQIDQISFSQARHGYDMEQVDKILEPLTEDYVALYKENALLKSKMRVLVGKLEEYRKAVISQAVTKGLNLTYYAWGKGIACLVSVAGAVCPWSLTGILLLPFLKKWVAFFRKPVYNGRNQGNGRTLCYSEKK